jgi:diguanylate cyclase
MFATVYNCLVYQHDLRLVALAVLICAVASFTALSVVRHVQRTNGPMRYLWLGVAATATGFGIWATHFIAMLAYEPRVPVAYDIGLTTLSLVLAIAITSIGLAVALRPQPRSLPLLGGAIVGAGVASMHYTGMWALELPGRVAWSPDLVAVSVALGIVFGSAALAVAVRREDPRGTLIAGLLLMPARRGDPAFCRAFVVIWSRL